MVDESEEIEALSIGQWVLVYYDGKQYPGETTKIKNSLTDIEINVMHQSGSKFWKWPTSQDKIYYQRKSITRIIEAPKVAGSRGQFTFEHLQQFKQFLHVEHYLRITINEPAFYIITLIHIVCPSRPSVTITFPKVHN